MRPTFRFILAFACAAAMPAVASAQAAPAADPHQHGQAAPAQPADEAAGHDAHAQTGTAEANCECPCCKAMMQMHGGMPMHGGGHGAQPTAPDAPEHQHGEPGTNR